MQVLVHPSSLPLPVPPAAAFAVDAAADAADTSDTANSADDIRNYAGHRPDDSNEDGESDSCSNSSRRKNGSRSSSAAMASGEEDNDGLLALEGLVDFAAEQATALGKLTGEAAVNATTLVVARPPVAENFEEFLEVVGAVDNFIDDSGLRGTVQVGCSEEATPDLTKYVVALIFLFHACPKDEVCQEDPALYYIPERTLCYVMLIQALKVR